MTPDEEGEILARRQVVPNRSYGRRRLDWITKWLAAFGAFLGAYQAGAEVWFQWWRMTG